MLSSDKKQQEENDDNDLDMLEKYGLIDENAIVRNHQKLWKYCQHVAGASLQAVTLSTTSNDEHCIAINWGG